MKDLKEIVSAFGGPGKVAEICGVKSQAVSQWKKVPPNHVLKLEEAGELTRHDLRPDIFGEAA